ncbi:hypothetical protein BsWGS_09049 [Bradybaena similaris]
MHLMILSLAVQDICNFHPNKTTSPLFRIFATFIQTKPHFRCSGYLQLSSKQNHISAVQDICNFHPNKTTSPLIRIFATFIQTKPHLRCTQVIPNLCAQHDLLSYNNTDST